MEKRRWYDRLLTHVQRDVALEMIQFIVFSLLIITGLMLWIFVVGFFFLRWLFSS